MNCPPILQQYFEAGYGREWPQSACSPDFLARRLQRPEGGKRLAVVLDTDTFNEVDDQYALAYLLKNPQRFDLKAILAAPFQNIKAETPALGMERSYQEILRVLKLVGQEEKAELVYRGAERFLKGETESEDTPAARRLVELALAQPDDEPLYVIGIAAATNLASAVLLEPAICQKIVVVWLGGHSRDWPNCKEFNLLQDIAAARVLLGTGLPVVQCPCNGVTNSLAVTGPELEHWLRGKNPLCDYLCDVTEKEAAIYHQEGCWSRIIWDVAPVAWLMEGDFAQSRLVTSVQPSYSGYYEVGSLRHPMGYIYSIDRDRVFTELFRVLSR